ncbi:MAG: hypothetical protein R3C53_27470 [Pirellulaceae bacterium]
MQFSVNVLLARHLTTANFDDYNVAMAIVLTLSTFATLGLEKYALLHLSVFRERQDWSGTRGFLRLSFVVVISLSVGLVVLAVTTLESLLALLGAGFHVGIPMAIAFLPMVAWGLFLVEGLTAYGRQILAATLYRIVMPASLLVINLVLMQWLGHDFSAFHAAIAFGLAWTITTSGLAHYFHSARPVLSLTETGTYESHKWLSGSLPLFGYSLLLTIQGQSGVLILEVLHPSDPMVSEYAMAWHIGTFLLLIATATNRFYLPIFSVLLERGDWNAFIHEWRMRRFWISLLILPFAIYILLFGEQVLAIFGSDYLRATPALIVIVVGTTLAVLFSPAPYVLQFLGQNRLVLYCSLLSVVATVSGSIYFGARFGSLGVAAAYATPLVLQFLVMKLLMIRTVQKHARRIKA